MAAPISDDPEKAKIAALLKQLLRERGYTHQSFAEVIGVSPGLVSQWATNRGAVPAERAMEVATLLHVEPEAISPSWRALKTQFFESQLQRLDFEIMARTVVVLRKYLQEVGDPPDFVEDPLMLEAAYEVVIEFGQPVTSANVIDLTTILEERVRRAKNGEDQVRGAGKKAGGKKR